MSETMTSAIVVGVRVDAEALRELHARLGTWFGHTHVGGCHATAQQPADQRPRHVAAAEEGDGSGLGIRGW